MSQTEPEPNESAAPTEGDPMRAALLAVNNLQYVMEPDLSISVHSCFKRQHWQQNEYTLNETAVCLLNTGADYIDTRTSFLGITLTNNSDRDILLTGMGAMNAIKRVTVTSRSGDELTRLDFVNALRTRVEVFSKDADWYESIGVNMGCEQLLPVNANYRFFIPLYFLSDLFSYGRLLPNTLMSGLRIEIEFEQYENWGVYYTAGTHVPTAVIGVLDTTNPTPVEYTMNGYQTGVNNAPTGSPVHDIKMEFALKSVQLTDSTQRAMNELSAQSGLEVVFHDWDVSRHHIGTGGLVHLDSRKAASRMNMAVIWRTDNGNADDPTVVPWDDPMLAYQEYQWQLGSMNYPQFPITTPDAARPDNLLLGYMHTLDAFGKLEPNARSCWMSPWSIDVNPYGNHPKLKRRAGAGVIAVNLNRSSMFALSGVPVNNSRVLSFKGTHTPAGESTAYFATRYVKLARVFMNNVEVEQ